MTTTYTATFFTDANYAIEEIDAKTPKQALAGARLLAEEPEELAFFGYDDSQPVNRIDIHDKKGGVVASWYDDYLRLRLAAGELLATLESQTEAAQAVIDNWEKGDLAAAVRSLDASIAESRDTIAKAKGGQP